MTPRLLAAIRTLLCALPLMLACPTAPAAELYVAVAANFLQAAKQVGAQFERQTGHRVHLSAGSSGKLYAQIKNGAPYDVFLSADVDRAQRLEQEKRAVSGSRFTYAVGRLVVWSVRLKHVDIDALRAARFNHLAVANPQIAPYGAAAFEVLERLELLPALRPRLVYGEDIGQTFQLAATGAADLAFVALSQLRGAPGDVGGAFWVVPPELYRPIEQQAVLLTRAEHNVPARQFLDFLKDANMRALLTRFGYALPGERGS